MMYLWYYQSGSLNSNGIRNRDSDFGWIAQQTRRFEGCYNKNMDKIFESVEKNERRVSIDWSLPALSRAWTFAYHDRRMFSKRDPWMRIGTQMLPRFRRIHIYQSIDNDVGMISTTFTAPLSIRVILLWSIFTRAR